MSLASVIKFRLGNCYKKNTVDPVTTSTGGFGARFVCLSPESKETLFTKAEMESVGKLHREFFGGADWSVQSEDIADPFVEPSVGETETVGQQMTFVDTLKGEILDMGVTDNAVAKVDGTPDVTLGKFLSRPTLIRTIGWATGGTIGVLDTFNPWNLFFANTQIKKKIDNYAFIRCRLHVKVIVNASPFYYGYGMLAYMPLEGEIGNPIRAATPFQPSITSYTQTPNIKIHPARSAGGEMLLPFFYHKNWLDLTSASDLTNMGTLRFININPILSANGVTGQTVSVQVYAWAEEVELMGPTVKLSVQAVDEYGDGPVSRPASAIAAVAGRLTGLPVIGKFAKATSIGASAVSSIASLFGYSNVPNIADVHAFQNSNMPHIASAGISTAIQKLTLDPKCELSVDPSIHGLASHDPLDLHYLLRKEALLATTTWATSDLVDSQLYNARVSPMLNNSNAETGAIRVACTPMAYIGNMFQFWRGDVVFRFKIICSKYHKGRLRFTYDPVGRIDTLADTTNTSFTQIIDIGEDNDIEIVIPYHQAVGWLLTNNLNSPYWTPGNTNAPNVLYDNGLINIRVLTQLSAPVATAPVYINVFVRGGDNLEFSVPTQERSDGQTVTSLFAVQAEDEIDIAPHQVTAGATTSAAHDDRFLQNFGESVKSLRTLLQRSTLAETGAILPAGSAQFNKWLQLFGRMPLAYGYDPNGIHTAVSLTGGSNAKFNYVPRHPLPLVTAMFRGYRGGVHHQFNVESTTWGILDNIWIFRHAGGRSAVNRLGSFIAVLATGTSPSTVWRFLNDSFTFGGLGGAATTSQRNNNTIGVSLPDFNRFNFRFSTPSSITLGTSSDGTDLDTYGLTTTFKTNTAALQATDGILVSRYCSIGSDFTPLFFICAPTLDIYTSQPAAV